MSDSRIAVGAIIVILGGILFFLPTLIASKRNHHNTTSIFLLNVTGIGWVIALIWAVAQPLTLRVVYVDAPAVEEENGLRGRRGGWKP
jgi:hypothetical protein